MQTQFLTLPIAGSIRHGEKQEKNGKTKPVELGHFVAKIQDVAMEHLKTKFQERYNNSKILNVYFIDEDPLTIRRVRYNQSGTACYCLLDQTKGKEKVGKKWTEKECQDTCEHRSAPEGKKPACTVEVTLKFMIPEISQDRIWYLKTSSYYSIRNISSYITLQKKLNNSLVGNYKLFLKPKETVIDGKTFNNFVLDIVKNDNFISNENSNQETIINIVTKKSLSLFVLKFLILLNRISFVLILVMVLYFLDFGMFDIDFDAVLIFLLIGL